MTTTVALGFAPLDGGTRVSVVFDTDARGLMCLAVGPFIRWYVGKWRLGMTTLKAKMESGDLRP